MSRNMVRYLHNFISSIANYSRRKRFLTGRKIIHKELKNRQNFCKGSSMMEMLPIFSSSAWVKKVMSILKINSQVTVIKQQI